MDKDREETVEIAGGIPPIYHNPYKGPNFFTEADKDSFFGREEEKKKLFQMVRNNFLTVVYGKSGIGKTSLLRAGLFPLLLNNRFYRIPLRLNYTNAKDTLIQQIRIAIREQILQNNIVILSNETNKQASSIQDQETLWEYFHRTYHQMNNKTVVPVIVLDQFEEFFTLGKRYNEKQKELLINELYWLVEDQFPDLLEDKPEIIDSYSKFKPDVRLIITLREDYLPSFIDLRKRFPMVDRNTLRVIHLNGVQAREAISGPINGFRDENTINNIIRFLYPAPFEDGVKGKFVDYDKIEVDPLFLSLLCYQLYNKKEQRTFPRSEKEYDSVLKEFYESIVNEILGHEKIEEFIELKLLTEAGFRTPFYVESKHPLRESIDRLVEKRILRVFHDGSKELVEIIHDVLAPIIKEKRQKRLDEKESTARKEKRKKNFYFFLSIALFIVVLISTYTIRYVQKQKNTAELNMLGSEALLELPRDNTRALCIAQLAFKKGLPDVNPRISRQLSTIGYSSFERPFYTARLTHNGAIYQAVFSPDGDRILTMSEDRTAKLWLPDGKQIAILGMHKDRIVSAAFSPNGNYIATASWDRSVKLWDRNGRFLINLPHDGIVTSVVFSPDNKMILSASRDGVARLWNITGKPLAVFSHEEAVESVAFSPDGKFVLTSSWDKTARLCTLDGRLLKKFQHNGALYSAVFSSNGKFILTASEDKSARLWSADGKIIHEIKHDNPVTSASFSPDDQKILTVSDDNIASLYTFDGKLQAEFKHTNPISCAFFSSDNRQIITASRDGVGRIWDINGKLKKILTQNSPVLYASFSPDSRYAVTAAEDGTARVWLLRSEILTDLEGYSEYATCAAFSPDCKWVVTGSRDKTARIWARDGKMVRILKGHNETLTSIDFSPDGKFILTGSNDNTAKLWSIDGKLLADLKRHTDAISSAIFSPDGKWILTASYDGSVKLWDKNGMFVKSFSHTSSVLSSAFSPDGTYVITAQADGELRVRNISSNGVIPIKLNNKNNVISASFSTDGEIILIATEYELLLSDSKGKTLKNFKPKKQVFGAMFCPHSSEFLVIFKDGSALKYDSYGEPTSGWEMHDKPIKSVQFSLDGKYIVSGDEDGLVKLWGNTGNLLAVMDKHKGPILSLLFSPDGKSILSSSQDGTTLIWYTPLSVHQWLSKSMNSNLSNQPGGVNCLK